MNVLYLGDVYAEPGILLVEKLLPDLIKKYKVDFTLAQVENLSEGKGIDPVDFERLRKAGVNFGTGGNWSLHNEKSVELLNNPEFPLIRPANYPEGTPGQRYKYAKTSQGNILVISLLGNVVGRDADKPMDNPLKVIDDILNIEKDKEKIATIVNFHGDYSSEKLVMGFYLDGKVSAVIGDHWHIPTADAKILPKGTAHITDVGMCGTINSSLGVKADVIINRWRDGLVSRNEVETEGPLQLNALLFSVDVSSGLSKSAELIQLTD